ncbi:1-acyl-sn-glycerol-3-phosphate acyltransferase [Endozoicomonas sp. SM1973]|uniref:1-acyl-sn-glycerol-3-phosphate acyltransferase n=1 Tax=Spartinivicinus marinus TaxID=2994442 RepID=A0A853ICE3_9GAMM|nr:1-acyl-sn-glycerol-3-phosphate acyltransferase [Spartinivicinus marinus]MCX4028520.1 1-acyl-sn-glycerol-3-phosphate acyltransferase [Spartinivicinus marinus]NYZ67187.1 1-acyl-sn-glycerol-3-phosphate acyltransferase [Spartinivicinus marinus]
MDKYEEIRPYHDHEVREVVDRLLYDDGFLESMAKFKLGKLATKLGPVINPCVRWLLRRELKPVNDVTSLQDAVEKYVDRVIHLTTTDVTFSGAEKLNKQQSYLFISNHRDIVLDPAFVNFALYHNNIKTPRLAIGDNLLTRPFVSDLMRLNKSFIVRRSVQGKREKLAAYQQLSSYINDSLAENESIWIAQREGRAKDGNDFSEAAIIKMLQLSQRGKDISFSDFINNLRLVPVAISYEYDPCDWLKARELYQTERDGHYQKASNEDVQSIVKGIRGFKGHVHIAFGEPLTGQLDTPQQVVDAMDRQILTHYRLYPANYFAYEKLEEAQQPLDWDKIGTEFPNIDLAARRQRFEERLASCNAAWRPWLLRMYANPVINKLKLQQS